MINHSKSILAGGLAAVSVLVSASAAQAECGCGHAHGTYGYYGGYYGRNYNAYLDEQPPYFAVHPPVYYSLPVPRTYGYSPFAYPGTVMTPEIEPTGPLDIINPHVPQEPKAATPASDQTAFRPQVVLNPFVATPGDLKLASQAKPSE